MGKGERLSGQGTQHCKGLEVIRSQVKSLKLENHVNLMWCFTLGYCENQIKHNPCYFSPLYFPLGDRLLGPLATSRMDTLK